jgi:hypothetical protein
MLHFRHCVLVHAEAAAGQPPLRTEAPRHERALLFENQGVWPPVLVHKAGTKPLSVTARA